MTEASERSIEERLTALESAVESLRRELAERQPRSRTAAWTPASTSAVQRDPRAVRRPIPDAAARPRPAPDAPPGFFTALFRHGTDFWISRVGIGLLLVGVVFLFKYAVDQGWLMPWTRVAFGVALGAALAAIGFRVPLRRRWFAQIMLGGAAASWYITGFAAFQLLDLVSFAAAFAFMIAVTVFTFWAGLRQDEAVLAVIAAVGGLGTPFFLYTESGSVPGLMAYTVLILVGTGAIYFWKGWHSLLWTTAAGAWLVVALGFRTETRTDQLALQAGIVAIWLTHWLVPVARTVLAAESPGRWPTPASSGPWRHAVRENADLAVLIVAMPLLAFFTSRVLWGAGSWPWGATALGGAALYAIATWRLTSRVNLALLATTHGVTAATFLAIGIEFLFSQDVVIVLWAVEAAGLHLLAPHLDPGGTRAPGRSALDYRTAANLLYLVVALWLFQRLVEGAAPAPAVFNGHAVANAAVIAVALLTASRLRPEAALVFRLAAHFAVLGWLARELSTLPTGSGLVTAAWGAYALGLLAFAPGARRVAVGTLFLAVAKLVLYDLSQVEPLWRILLFLGFGAVFLAVSYYATDRTGRNPQD